MLFFSVTYHFSKQFLSNLSKIKYLAFFITFCFVVSLVKMVTLTNNFVYKKSAQYRKYIWSIEHICHHLWVGATANPPQSDDRYAQLTRGAFKINDFLLNPHFSIVSIPKICRDVKFFLISYLKTI